MKINLKTYEVNSTGEPMYYQFDISNLPSRAVSDIRTLSHRGYSFSEEQIDKIQKGEWDNLVPDKELLLFGNN